MLAWGNWSSQYEFFHALEIHLRTFSSTHHIIFRQSHSRTGTQLSNIVAEKSKKIEITSKKYIPQAHLVPQDYRASLGVIFIFVVCLLLMIYVNRGNTRRDPKSKGASRERLRKLDAVSPICRLDQWWPNVKGSLGLPEAADNQFICVVCLEPVLNSQEIHQLKCMHVFHKECLEKWYLGDHFNCPLCHRAYFHEARRPMSDDFVWMV
ncbi:hypothetical protein DTO164E3_1296 [Paecilomyces variotii]|nr:hypothetical protein DTO032I3_5866 [Paecilomyces variotii]KAJ9205318.1 hypothetical protein DTO164E3_1296 [Paecilomyces variotii]KAJ9280114.1 hypothetical protein DTO021D3_3031 [Paecilomyces variotii]KAJ9342493.1 hypothetical protein DTO027B6_5011 [Paecilomyces variotii]KAJ9382813.1 hypothetical protein DTO032I4_5461 [Paecilomyces variotii]